jgi:hypothetical protein
MPVFMSNTITAAITTAANDRFSTIDAGEIAIFSKTGTSI